jgi:hypothetical protein
MSCYLQNLRKMTKELKIYDGEIAASSTKAVGKTG